ncbi:polyvinylalcohol dehydrogenase [Aliidongia dinghuensis]|uniref:Polyvinylalcohol dehydrogenase n=1 Tax=Aliidongia dinghuensis TaxID=1867774 RepID=A0A8J3E6T3_9PROT|nr:PQQ-binding-like beta-propeller repeat protein [Aliidongia dinghuensis]GGF47822.1 polyvinylalcohol dehydrogenase [Aliidongia dinghuensis]
MALYRPIVALLALVAVAAPVAGMAQAWLAGDGEWRAAGGNLADTHGSATVWQIGPSNAGSLAPKWVFTTAGDVSATPTVEGAALYVPDWGGMLYRLDATTGTVVWERKLSDYTGNTHSLSRSSPAIAQRTIIVGDEASGTILAIDKATGQLVWRTLVEPLRAALVTASPTVLGNLVYVGISSQEEGLAQQRTGYVPSFRGTIAALDVATGRVVWSFRTVPEGYTGGAVWSSTFAIDVKRGALYATTGNNYTVPAPVTTCLQAAKTPEQQSACLAPDDYIDSIVALDLFTGQVKWSRRMIGADTYVNSCIASPPRGIPCPNPRGPDFDFGAGANLFTTTIGGQLVDLVGAGQKSGIYWALDPDTGKTLWATQVGPGGGAGGIMWGTASDGARVYAAINDSNATPYALLPAGTVEWRAGSWAALDAATGRILWQIPATGKNPFNPALDAGALGALSVANGVVYAGSMSGDMVAIGAAGGNILWKFASGGSVICGPSIAGGMVYWGSGYRRLLGTGNDKLYAFTAPPAY